MKRHVFMNLYEASSKKTFTPTANDDRSAGVTVHKDSDDSYDPDTQYSIFDKKWDTTRTRGVINYIAGKFARYFKALAKTNDTAKASIEALGLDNNKKGALGLAHLYGRLLNDMMVDANGNRIELNSDDDFNLFKSRLLRQLGDTSLIYPVFFMLGHDILVDGEMAQSGTGMVSLVRWFKNIADQLGVDNMADLYKQKENIDSVQGAVPLRRMRGKVNGYLERMRDDAVQGRVADGDVIGIPTAEYMKLYYGDEGAGEDGEVSGDKITQFKKEMAQSILDAKASGDKSFDRGSFQDEVVDKWYPEFLDNEEDLDAFINAIIKASVGTSPAMTSKFLNAVVNTFGEDKARDIMNTSSTVTKTTKSDAPAKITKDNGLDFDVTNNSKQIYDAVYSDTTKELIDSAKALKNVQFSYDDLVFVTDALADRVKSGDTIVRSTGRGSGKDHPFTQQHVWDFKQAMQLAPKIRQMNSSRTKQESVAESYIDGVFDYL